MKKENAGGRQNWVGQGNGKIWDLKYKNSEDLEIKWKKCNNHHHIHNQWAKTDRDEERIRVF